jgi:hypothetical protein
VKPSPEVVDGVEKLTLDEAADVRVAARLLLSLWEQRAKGMADRRDDGHWYAIATASDAKPICALAEELAAALRDPNGTGRLNDGRLQIMNAAGTSRCRGTALDNLAIRMLASDSDVEVAEAFLYVSSADDGTTFLIPLKRLVSGNSPLAYWALSLVSKYESDEYRRRPGAPVANPGASDALQPHGEK